MVEFSVVCELVQLPIRRLVQAVLAAHFLTTETHLLDLPVKFRLLRLRSGLNAFQGLGVIADGSSGIGGN